MPGCVGLMNARTRSLTLVLLTVFVVLGLVLHEIGRLPPIEDLALYLVTPLQAGLASLTGRVADLTQTSRDLGQLRERNEELEAENARLLIENVRLKEYEAENEELRRLLGFTQSTPAFQYKAAQVIGRDSSPLLKYIIIDVGTDGGVGSAMPVVTERGLIGQVVEASSASAKVLLLTDVSSSVNALVQSSRATGVVEGQIGGGVVMRYVLQGEEIAVGDIVVTSGLGDRFPPGLVIGQVTDVQQRDIDMFQQAEIRPTVDFRNLEIVLVITNYQPIARPGAGR